MRRTKTVTITAQNRDHGKNFLLTEMPAARAEKWAARAFLALAKSGVELPDSTTTNGMAGFATVGFEAIGKLDWADAEPLLDEMMTCVQIVPSPNIVRALVPGADDIEEVSTLFTLRKELLELHLGFSLAASPSTSESEAAQTNG